MATKPTRPATTPKRAPIPEPSGVTTPPASGGPGGKLGILVQLLGQSGGATVEEMSLATGWQAHSVRGAMAGSLKERGFTAVSVKPDAKSPRRYHLDDLSSRNGEG